MTDAEIAAAALAAFEWDAYLPDDRIAVAVANGRVTLTGTVDTEAQRDDATRALRDIAGIRSVDNRIAIAQPAFTPDTLRAAIQTALERHADREARHLRIEIDDGNVTVEGVVQSKHEHDAVVGVVATTRGVKRVTDRIRIV